MDNLKVRWNNLAVALVCLVAAAVLAGTPYAGAGWLFVVVAIGALVMAVDATTPEKDRP